MPGMEKAEFEFKLVDSMSAPLSKIKGSAAGLDAAFKKTTSSSGGFGMLKSMIGGNLIAGGIASIGAGMKNLAKFAIGAGADMQKARIGFQTLVGDVEKGNKLFEETSEFANVTPFRTDEVQKAGKTLLAFGVKAEDIMGTMNLLGDVSALSTRSFDDMAMIYGKVVSNGKLMGQELNMLVDAGFNPLQQISEDTGESMMSLRKRMSLGQISVEDVNQAFKNATAEGGRFNGGMENISQTIGGKWSTLMGKVTFLIGSMVESSAGFFTTVIDGMIATVDWVGKNLDILTILGTTIGGVALAFGTYATIMGVVSLVTAEVTIATKLLNFVMSINPIGAVIAAVAGLVAIFTVLYQKNKAVRGFFDGIWSGIKKFGDNISNFVKSTFSPFLTAWDEFQKGNYGSAAKALGKGVFNIAGVFANASGLGEGDGLFSGLGEAYTTGKLKSKMGFSAEQLAAAASTGTSGVKSAANTSGDTKSKAKDKNKTSVSGASSGRPTNINVEIGSLIETFNVKADNLEKMQRQVKDAVSRALVSAVNDVNLIAE
jgi:tape measure domain-containing protein